VRPIEPAAKLAPEVAVAAYILGVITGKSVTGWDSVATPAARKLLLGLPEPPFAVETFTA
jgi:hypothetical protein